jgi:hypothetical protein
MAEHGPLLNCKFSAMWTSPSGAEYRKQDGAWRRYSIPGVWQSSARVNMLEAEMLDAIAPQMCSLADTLENER